MIIGDLHSTSSAIKPAAFVHIQKTAGTTIVNLARSAYGNEHVISHGDFFDGLDHFPLADYEYFQKEQMRKKFGNIRFLSGHFGYDFAKQFIRDRYSFTFLRNPVERVLSFYFYCKSCDPTKFEIYELSQRLSLNEFLKLGFSAPQIRGFIWNCQVVQLAHGFGSSKGSDMTEKELLNLAIRHLNDFSYVGFTETFEKDRDNILRDLGIAVPEEKIISNANPDRPVFDDLSRPTKKLLLDLTELDRVLYNKAWHRKNALVKTGIKKWLKV
jgi:hypothetical protein